MKKPLLVLLAVALSATSVVPSNAARKVVRLGSDPAGDGPPALDVTFLDVTRTKDSLEIRIGIDTMLPGTGGYPEGPAIQWVFTTGKRAFIAEAVASRTPRWFFFELFEDSYEQLQGMTGTYDWNDGFIRMLVPLDLIGAKKGTRISGFHDLEILGKTNGTDVDSHLHTTPGQTEYIDELKTTKSYRIP
jgi:hypothetical protein